MKYENEAICVEIHDDSGRLISLDGRQKLLSPDGGLPLFTLRFRDPAGNSSSVTSDEMRFSQDRSHEEGGLGVLTFEGMAESLRVEVRLGCGDKKSEINWRFRVSHAREGYLERLEFPGVVVPNDLIGNGGESVLFSPMVEGVLIETLAQRESCWLKYESIEYPNHGWCGYYPGNAQMQFMAYCRKDEVLYFASHDPFHTTKELEFCSVEGGIHLIMRAFPGAIPAGDYEMPYPIVMGVFPGDWQDAALRYREWIQSGEVSLPPKLTERKFASWLEDSPVIATYPITGEGHHSGPTQPNEFFPFVNALPVIEELGRALDSRILTLLMHWEGTAPWSPPYVWPPRGGEEGLRLFSEGLHQRGHLLGVYCSGAAWTNRSNTGDGGYSRQEELDRDGLIRHMCMGPKGEYQCKICNGEEIRFGYDICAASEFAHEVMVAETLKIASVDVDYIQLMDQNLGGAAYQCYDPRHGHPSAPGPWQSKAMNALLGDIRSQLVGAGKGDIILGCEAAAAECYLENLPLNDLRFHMGFAFGRPVPAFAFVFHEYTSNFMGNQVECALLLDENKAPHHLMLRLAHSFCAGDLLTVVLKNGGQIHWSWCMKWEVAAPPQEPLVAFINHLNAWRKGVGKPFLFFGRMEKTIPFEGAASLPLPTKFGNSLDYSSVMASRWQSPDGRDAQIFVNYSESAQTIRLRSRKAFHLWRDPTSDCPESSASPDILIPAFQAVLVEFQASLAE